MTWNSPLSCNVESYIGGEKMEFTVKVQGIWYHGSNKVFETLEEGSTITQWK